MDPVQPSLCQTVLDRLRAQAKVEQLPPSNHSMLLRGERPSLFWQLLIG
ncbi:MAG TPA: hypothetical protein VJQ84_02135 [Solirubrobacterales bacterium]|nr:hypothetical protein [Solirubrobacterales bacterium]